jgi:predicted nucleic acid-binding protein
VFKVYLDTSTYNRPFDDQTQPKIFLETQAAIIIFQMIEAKLIELVNSSVLEYENGQNSFPRRQQLMDRYLRMASFKQEVNEAIKLRAEQLEQEGLKAVDALHVACAETASSDYFITCDKRLINRYKGNIIHVLNPVDFVLEVGHDPSKE